MCNCESIQITLPPETVARVKHLRALQARRDKLYDLLRELKERHLLVNKQIMEADAELSGVSAELETARRAAASDVLKLVE